MCGIFGVIHPQSLEGLESSARVLTHRGPDAFDSYLSPTSTVYLAHCRLSIIDVSEAGRQPMSNEDGSVWLTFNGEIYNYRELTQTLLGLGHRFKSKTDSEAIVHAYEEWGQEFIHRLTGMFAFALWDSKIQKLYLYRDRVGIKPLYYRATETGLSFASEPKAIVTLPGFEKDIEAEALRCFLTYGYVAGEKSIWKGIRRLMPGCMAEYDVRSKSFQVSRYWSVDCSDRIDSLETAVEQFEALFSDIIEDHLISDVPLGVFLSGGIDSTSISAAATKHQTGLESFSIGFRGAEIDELPVAGKTARRLGLTHREFVIDRHMRPELMKAFAYMDEPLADTSIFPTYLVSKEARRYVKVALSGDGGDELFGGYNWYFQTEDARRVKRLMFLLGRILGPVVTGKHPQLKRLDEYQHYLMLNSPGFTNEELMRLFSGITSARSLSSETYLYRSHANRNHRSYKHWQLIDFQTYLVENNLVKDDRLSMANSLEVRVPLLDHRLVELAFSLDNRVNIENRQGKQILRRFLNDAGLQHVLNWPKKGFSFDVNSIWPTKDMVDMLRRGRLRSDEVIDHGAMETLFAEENQNQYKIWLLAVLEVWYCTWFLETGTELYA